MIERALKKFTDASMITDDLPLWSAPFGLRLLEEIECKTSMRVIDIGSGLGFPLLEIAMRLGDGSQVIGIDPSIEGVSLANRKTRLSSIPNAFLLLARGERIPFKDLTFDLVVSNNGLNNVQNLSRTLSECNRVSRKGAQFVFTMNTDRTFARFYEVFRKTLYEMKLQEYLSFLSEHIRRKRIPLLHLENRLTSFGFKVQKVVDDKFSYRFATGTAMMNHFLIRTAFLPSWRKILPSEFRDDVFRRIEGELNEIAQMSGSLDMEVPFATFNCRKT